MNDLIEKLKDKNYVRAFGLHPPEEQECFKKVGTDNCVIYTDVPSWVIVGPDYFADSRTYAIKPDYKPEPEYVDLEITTTVDDQVVYLGCWIEGKGFNFSGFRRLECLPSLPNFKDFWYDTDAGTRFNFTDDGRVASLRDEGHTVYARFRTTNNYFY